MLLVFPVEESDDDLLEDLPAKPGLEETVVHNIELERGRD